MEKTIKDAALEKRFEQKGVSHCKDSLKRIQGYVTLTCLSKQALVHCVLIFYMLLG